MNNETSKTFEIKEHICFLNPIQEGDSFSMQIYDKSEIYCFVKLGRLYLMRLVRKDDSKP